MKCTQIASLQAQQRATQSIGYNDLAKNKHSMQDATKPSGTINNKII
jgi:hypothetical protein